MQSGSEGLDRDLARIALLEEVAEVVEALRIDRKREKKIKVGGAEDLDMGLEEAGAQTANSTHLIQVMEVTMTCHGDIIIITWKGRKKEGG